jgi:hypothetical protein
MLWLECDQFVQNYSILSGKDVLRHAMQIHKKFFREQSSFSIISSLPEKLARKAEKLSSVAQHTADATSM